MIFQGSGPWQQWSFSSNQSLQPTIDLATVPDVVDDDFLFPDRGSFVAMIEAYPWSLRYVRFQSLQSRHFESILQRVSIRKSISYRESESFGTTNSPSFLLVVYGFIDQMDRIRCPSSRAPGQLPHPEPGAERPAIISLDVLNDNLGRFSQIGIGDPRDRDTLKLSSRCCRSARQSITFQDRVVFGSNHTECS